ncbi:MAG: autotransporter domain-containing protein [Phascolarctobacterium sp.]|nr:autotransporter domain-containing protein [Phascolarctobacterium sp.]
MSNKDVKRSLALGALMAFVITGQVWAAEEKAVVVTNNTTHKNKNDYHFLVSNSDVVELGNVDLTVTGNGMTFSGVTKSDGNVQGGEAVNENPNVNLHATGLKIVTGGDNNGIQLHYGAKLDLDVEGELSITATGHGINTGGAMDGKVDITAGGVTISAGENAVYTYKDVTSVKNKENSIVINAENVTLTSSYAGSDTYNGYAVMAASQNSTIDINATGDVKLAGKNSGVKAINGSTVEVTGNGQNVLTVTGVAGIGNALTAGKDGVVTIKGFDAIKLDGNWDSSENKIKNVDRNIFYVNDGIMNLGSKEAPINIIDTEHFSFNADGWGSIVFHVHKGEMNVNANKIHIENFTNGIYAQDEALLNINANEIVLNSQTTNSVIGIGTYPNDEGASKLNVTSGSLRIDAPNASAISASEGLYNGVVGEKVEGNINIVADNIDIIAKKGINVYKGATTTEKAGVTVDATNYLKITSSEAAVKADNLGMAYVEAPSIELKTEAESATALKAVDALNSSDVTLDGASNITVTNNGTGSAYGINLENKSTATLGATTITSTSVSGNGFGFRLASGQEIKNGVTTVSGNTVTVGGNANITANGANYAQGIYSQYSDVTFEKDAIITATSTGDYAYAVRMLGDADSDTKKHTNSKITFEGETTNLTAKSNGEAFGILTSGSNNGGANFNGTNVTIEVEGKTKAYGVYAQYDTMAVTSANTTDVSINANSSDGQAYGIYTGEYADGVGKVDFNGNVIVGAEGNSAYGVEAIEGSSVSLGSAGKAVSITATGKGTASTDEAISVFAGNADSKVDITAGTLTVNATSKNTNQPGSSLQAKEGGMVNVVAGTANIDGMMYAEGQDSRINVTANTAANIKGDIFTENNGVVVLKLKGTNASYTGATNIESAVGEENSDADKGATLVLEKGATWYVTGNSTVSGIIGDEFNVKAAEGVKGAVVTIDGHLPNDINDDYDDTVSTITGVDFVINEDGDGLGGNVTLNSDSDITVNATERGIYAEKDTHVNIKAATLTLNNKEGCDAINVNGEVNIDAANLVFNGKVVADGEDSVVNITTGDFAYDANKQFATENNGVINIAGGNISGELKVIGGNVNLTAGNVTSTLNIAKGSTVSLTGATIETKDLASIFSKDNEGKLVIDGTGVLKTKADQVFTVAEDTKATTGLEGNKVIDDKVTYKAGTVSLSDDYSYEYLSSINDAMKAYKYDGNNASTTKLVMTGKLVTAVEEVEKSEGTINVDQASNLGNEVQLDKVTVEAENNLLIGAVVPEDGSVQVKAGDDTIVVKDSVANGFAAKQLKLSEDSTGAVITGNQTVTLGGSEDCDNLVSAGETNKPVKVVVGTAHDTDGIGDHNHDHDGTLNIGNKLANKDTKYELNGSVHVNAGSQLNTKGQTKITDGVELENGTVNVEKDSHLHADIKVQGDKHSTITGKVTGNLHVDDGHKDAKVHLGSGEHAGKMHAEKSKLNGATLFLDPAYADGIDKGSEFALKEAANLDGAYVAGQNSTISFGVDNLEAAHAVFAETELTFGSGTQNGNTVNGDVNAVIYIADSVSLNNAEGKLAGSITANGALTSADNYTVTAGKVTFADKSLLMVEAEKVANKAAISDVTATDVNDNAKLYINNAQKDGEYKILAGSSISTVWADDNIITNNKLIAFEGSATGNAFDVKAVSQSVNDVYGDDVIIGEVVDESIANGGSSSDIFNSAANEDINVDRNAQVDALNSIGSMNELAGVTHTTYAASNILTDAVADHMSLANDKEHDKDIWAHYVHTKENVDGLKRAGAYDAQYNGIVVGTDLYNEGKATVGAALTYVDGNINGSSVAARTENDAKYYGASVYGSIQNDDTAVIADVSYLHGEHDITQRNSGKVITGEPESDAFSVGVRVEKEAKAGIGKLVPYAGLRYMHLGTGNYTNSIGLAYNADDAELFLLPVGLKYSADIKNTNGWTMRPVVEFGYVWAFGDTDADQTVSLNGASNGFGYDVTDSGSYVGRFMLEAEKANISYALGYEYQKGDNVEADKWMVNVNWKF